MWTAPAGSLIESVEALREIYRPPTETIANKKATDIAPWARVFIAAAPFAVLATADTEGRPTVSPKGGAPGFVTILDEHHLALPDYAGNNLIDSLRNLMVNQHVGLMFMIPGRGETVRVDGSAVVTTDPDMLQRFADGSRRPKSVIVIEVRDVFVHCPASMQRAQLWQPDSWRTDGDLGYHEFVIAEMRRTTPPDELPDWAR